MAEYTFADLLQSAKEAPQTSFAPDLDAPGTYTAEVTTATHKLTTNGKLQVGIRFKVQGGPKDGHAIWANQTLSPESPAALDIFFRTFEALGIPRDAWAKYGANVEQAGEAVANAITGATAQIKVAMGKASGGYAAKLEVKFVNPLSRTAAPAAPAAPQIPAQPAAPAAPVAPLAPPRAPF